MNKGKSERIIFNKLESISKFIDKPVTKFTQVDLEAIRDDVQIALSEIQSMMDKNTKYKLVCEECNVEIRGAKGVTGKWHVDPYIRDMEMADFQTNEFTLSEIEDLGNDNPYYNWDMFKTELAND